MNHEVLFTEQQIVNVLLLEDDDVDYQSITRQLDNSPTQFQISRAQALRDACDHLERQQYDLVITDLRLPDSEGLDTVTTLKEYCGNAILLVLTGLDDEKVEQDALNQGVHGFFVKNEFQGRSISRTIQHSLRCERSMRHNRSLVEHLRNQQNSLEAFSQQLNEENKLLRGVHELRHSAEATSFEHLTNHLSKDAIAILAVEAEQASRAKSEFLSTVCHELRTTMEGLLAINDHLTKTHLTDQQKAFVDASLTNTATIYRMIGEMSEIARIESGRAKVQQFLCDMEAVIKEVAQTGMPLLQSKQIDLKWFCDEAFSESVLCDGKIIRQILVLLLSNAIKFTTQGCIEIRGTILSKNRSGGKLRISVADTGVGVPPETLDDLKAAFNQGSLRQMPPLLNPSLGLSLALQMTRLLGGEMGVESERWKGSRFWIDIPVRYPNQEASHRLDGSNDHALGGPKYLRRNGNTNGNPPKSSGKHVLVGHASRPLQLYLVEQLRQLGYTADTAKDGSDVMYLLGKKKFDLLMIDCHLPVHDAFVIANRMDGVIKLQSDQSPPRMIAISDRLMVDNLSPSSGERINGFLTIPLEITRLREAIEQCMKVAT